MTVNSTKMTTIKLTANDFPQPAVQILQEPPDVIIEGEEGLNRRLKRIERVLGIGQRDHELESRHLDLKNLGDRYDSDLEKAMTVISDTLGQIYADYNEYAGQCRVLDKLNEKND